MLLSPALQTLASLAVVVFAAQLFGWVFRKLGQPSVVGEILGGLLLGPSGLGRFSPELMGLLFPPANHGNLMTVAQIGVLLFMFFTGIEFDLASFRRRSRASFAIAGSSLLFPFALGALLSLFLFDGYSGNAENRSAFTLFGGVALCVTAFPVLARILAERGMQRTELGTMALGCAALNDVAAWCLLALVTGVVRSRADGSLATVALTGLFLAAMLLLAAPVRRWLERKDEGGKPLPHAAFVPLVLGWLLSSALAEWIGIHALFGAFLFGAIIPARNRLAGSTLRSVDTFVRFLLLPSFFAITGLRTDIWALSWEGDLLVLFLVLVTAITGKLLGTMVAARVAGFGWRESSLLGVLMNTRGLVELVVLNVGLDLQVISPKLFSILVFMALFTTYMTGPLLHLVGKRGKAVSPAL